MSTNITQAQCAALGPQVEWRGGPQVTPNPDAQAQAAPATDKTGGFLGMLYNILTPQRWVAGALGWTVSMTLLPLAAYITDLAGVVLNYSVFFTVVQMAHNLNSESNTINTAWSLVRDVANIGFIFILLYAAIKTILGVGEDNQRLIVGMIVAAVLVNFSLFFTKLIIDAANVIALFFYDAIAPGVANGDWHVGISNALMAPLKLQSIWHSSSGFDNRILIIGVMGIVLALVAAFVFFAVALLFIIRYVVLLFVLILSPLMFVSMVLPNTQQYTKQWWEALSGQALFAPLYFLLTWVVVVLSNGLFKNFSGSLANIAGTVAGQTNPPTDDSIVLLVNFIIIIALLIGSLIIAKNGASKGGKGMGSLVNYATGLAGGATIGLAGRFGRNTFGRVGTVVGDSDRLKRMAAQGGAKGFIAKQAMVAGRGVGGTNFDLRGAGFAKDLGAGKANKGGYADYRKKKAEDEAKFATSLAPSDKEKTKARAALEDAEKKFGKDSVEARAARKTVDDLEGLKKEDVNKRKAEVDKEKAEVFKNSSVIADEKALLDRIEETEDQLIEAKRADDMVTYSKLAAELSQLNERRKIVSKEADRFRQQTEREYETKKSAIKETKGVGEERKQQYATAVEKAAWAKFRGYNYAAAAQIRKGKKPVRETLEEILKTEGEIKETEEKVEEATEKAAEKEGGAT